MVKKKEEAAAKHTHNNDHEHEHGHGPHDHSHSHKHTKAVLNRLARVIGHLTAVRGMVEKERDCAEVLIQLAAVRSAIDSTCAVILKDHFEHCVVDAMATGDMSTMEELKRAVELLIK
jgi:DNA-binding FrmR family transcriptional regulator